MFRLLRMDVLTLLKCDNQRLEKLWSRCRADCDCLFWGEVLAIQKKMVWTRKSERQRAFLSVSIWDNNPWSCCLRGRTTVSYGQTKTNQQDNKPNWCEWSHFECKVIMNFQGNFLFHHNFIREHEALSGQTPVEACGVQIEGRTSREFWYRT